MKYKEIVKIIKNISLALPDVESFYTGDVYEINKDQSVKYGSVVLTNQEHSFDNINDQFNYNFVLFYIDRLTDDEANRIDVQTAGINALTTIVKTIEDYGCIIDNVRYNVFKERFNDWCSGVYGTFSIQVDDNDCVTEFEIITPEKLKAITINSNGTYKGLFDEVNVNVPDKEFLTETKSIDINENGTYSVEKSDNVDGMSSVEINVNVAIPEPNLQTKSISITENGTQIINADNGYDGLQSVSITTNISGTTSDKIMLTDGTKFAYSKAFDASLYDTSQVTDFGYMFNNCSGLTSLDLSNFDTSYAITMEHMFYACKYLTSLDLSNFDTSNVTRMDDMFNDCQALASLDLSNFNISSVTNTSGMFYHCINLTSLDLSNFNTSSVTRMENMFGYCSGLTSLDLSNFNTSKVTDMTLTFISCTNLTSLNLSGWNMNNVTSMSSTFRNCSALTDLNMNGAILPKMNLTRWYLDSCPLSVESLVSVLNALPQLSSSESFTCTIGATNLAKLTDAEKRIATNKNWILN